METTNRPRPARMEFKTSADTKELLSEAAALDGVDLTAFVLGSAIERARRVISQHNSIALSREGQAALVRLLSQPASPTDAMRDLMRLPDLPTRQS
jgi:uncharacterized protein (DUF1778 family)